MIKRLLELGINDSNSYTENRKITLVNLALVVLFATVVFFIFYNFFVLDKPILASTEVIILFLVIGLLFLQKKGHVRFVRVALAIILQTFSIALIMFLARGRMAEYFLFVIMMLFMMLFYDKKFFIPLYFFNLIMFYMPQILYEPYPPEIFSWTNPIVTFVSLAVVIYYFHKSWRYNETLLAEKNKELERLNEEKSHLISIAAHDLKSPLSRIDGLLSIIQMTASNLTEEQKELIEKISEVSRNQNEMIRQVLDLKSIDATEKSDLQLTKVGLSALIDQLMESFEPSANNKDIALVKTGQTQEVFIHTEPVYLQNALENILSNAIKFSPPNTQVSLGIKDNGSNVNISISDNGPGLSEEDKKKLFGRFVKLTPKPTGSESSSGLGLSIAKQYVESLNGEITCESLLGKGSTFSIVLPKS